MNKVRYLVLYLVFFTLSVPTFASEANTTKININLIFYDSGLPVFDGRDVSIHMCPVKNWRKYDIKLHNGNQNTVKDLDYVNLITDHQVDGGFDHNLVITWPTDESLDIVCKPNGTSITTNTDSAVVIITNYIPLIK